MLADRALYRARRPKRSGLTSEAHCRAWEAINRYVSAGGTLYASCLAWRSIAAIFPEAIGESQEGTWPTVSDEFKAQVSDPGMRGEFGRESALKFDLGGWKPPAFKEDAVVYLSGTYKKKDVDEPTFGPLLATMSVGEGCIICAVFHNGKQRSRREFDLWRYLVYTTVTARLDHVPASNSSRRASRRPGTTS